MAHGLVVNLILLQMDTEKDVFKQISSVQEEVAPKNIAKHTMEDDIGMVHELTQVCFFPHVLHLIQNHLLHKSRVGI